MGRYTAADVNQMSKMYERGYCVTGAEQYYKDDDPAQPHLRMTMETGMTGTTATGEHYLFGYCDINLMPDRNGKKEVTDPQLYIYDDGAQGLKPDAKSPDYRYIDDVSYKGQPLQIRENGVKLSKDAALQNVAEFGELGSRFPHVMDYEEFMIARAGVAGRFNMQPPEDKDYDAYLQQCRNEMMQGIRYVGLIQTPRQVDAMRAEFVENQLAGLYGPAKSGVPDFDTSAYNF